MDILQITQAVSMAIPIASFAALFLSVWYFVRMRGSIDALKEAAETYRTLAESKDAKIDELEEKIDRLETQIRELQKTLEVQKEALRLAVDEFLQQVRGGL